MEQHVVNKNEPFMQYERACSRIIVCPSISEGWGSTSDKQDDLIETSFHYPFDALECGRRGRGRQRSRRRRAAVTEFRSADQPGQRATVGAGVGGGHGATAPAHRRGE